MSNKNMNFKNSFKDFEDFSLNMKDPCHGEVVYIQETNCFMFFDENDGWHEISEELVDKVNAAGSFNMGLYDLNKSIIYQMGELNFGDVKIYNDKVDLMNNFRNNTRNKFYLMYGKEISYFTLFMVNNGEEDTDLARSVLDCLEHLGPVYSIEYTKDRDAIEIWVCQEINNEMTCLYLFPYDAGIVPIKE